ncbi:MAG TPA: hypothetical protein VHS97_13770, partial [Isosphaeraceae bacterium]|nr:hypothetical protein [Isosphaeraceae bacterium]
AWAILPRRARQKVTLVTPGSLFLEKVFEAIPLIDLDVVKVPPDGMAPAAGAAATGASASITIYDRKVADILPAGHVLVIEPEKSGPLWDLGETIHNPVVAKQDKDSPLMAHIRLDNVLMPEARKLALKLPGKVLAESASGDALYAVLDRPEPAQQGKVVLLTVNLDKSDLPLQTAFPIMVTNLLNWFGGTKGELREALAAGSVAEVELPADKSAESHFVLKSPGGTETPVVVPAGAAKVTVGPLDRTGVWRVLKRSAKGLVSAKKGKDAIDPRDVVAELACNLADRRESDLRPAVEPADRRPGLAAGLAVRPIWYYLLASALMLTCWEWFLYQRRWID